MPFWSWRRREISPHHQDNNGIARRRRLTRPGYPREQEGGLAIIARSGRTVAAGTAAAAALLLSGCSPKYEVTAGILRQDDGTLAVVVEVCDASVSRVWIEQAGDPSVELGSVDVDYGEFSRHTIALSDLVDVAQLPPNAVIVLGLDDTDNEYRGPRDFTPALLAELPPRQVALRLEYPRTNSVDGAGQTRRVEDPSQSATLNVMDERYLSDLKCPP